MVIVRRVPIIKELRHQGYNIIGNNDTEIYRYPVGFDYSLIIDTTIYPTNFQVRYTGDDIPRKDEILILAANEAEKNDWNI